jgi:CRISPR-associated protein Csx14
MTNEIRIPMDPFNPGQFYACCGLAEIFGLLGGKPLTRFEVDERLPRRAQFVLADCIELELTRVIQTLRESKCEAIELPGKDGERTIAPVKFVLGEREFELDWWLDDFREKATSLKCWAGQQTSASIAAELLRVLPGEIHTNLFVQPAMTSTRFGVDPRSAWSAVDIGYSPNEHQQDAATFAAVELLAAIGLQGFRPNGTRRDGFRYALWRTMLPLNSSRLACAEPWDGLDAAAFSFRLGERGNYKFFRFSKPIEKKGI